MGGHGIEDAPLVLQGATVGRAFGKQGGNFVGTAADAEAANGSLLNEIFHETEEGFVVEIICLDFVEEPEVEAGGAEVGEAAVEGGSGLRGSERRALPVLYGRPDSGAGCASEMFFDAGELVDDRACDSSAESDQRDIF